ncbi:MAG: alcohol dehydrogenase catalytic domain-containing protein [Verrucomicrobiota bacterium]
MPSMPAVCLMSNEAEDIRVIEAPVPEPGPGQVLLKPLKAGICGSDISAYLAKPHFNHVIRPRILGHEFCAEIADLGPGVTGFEVGQRVCPIAVQSCGECEACRRGNTQQCRDRRIIGFHFDGGMAGYCVCRTEWLMPIRYGLSDTEAALIEPLSVSSRCVVRNCDIKPGQSVIVSGPGIIGMFCALVARALGGQVTVTGAEADAAVRLKTAADLGFDTLTVSDANPLHEQLEEPVDCLIEASGDPNAVALAGKSVKWGGEISLVATYSRSTTFNPTDYVRAEQQIRTTMASTWGDFERAQKHLRDRIVPVETLVREYPLDEAVEAFADSRDKATAKAVLRIA